MVRTIKRRLILALTLAVGFLAFEADTTLAQGVSNYCVFGDESVRFGPITKTGDGAVGSNGDIILNGSYRVAGVEGGGSFLGGTNGVADFITMNGNVTINGGTRVTNDLNAGGFVRTGTNITIGYGGVGNAVAGGDVTLIGGNRVFGDVDAGGNVALNNNTAHVYGDVTAAGTYSQTPFATVDGTITDFGVPATPLAYTPVPFPPASTFSSGGPSVTNPGAGGTTLAPGSYGAFNVTGARTSVTLTAGDYYFDSFDFRSTYPALTFDVSLGAIQVFVTGDVTIRQSAKISVVGGGAERVYLETHGNFRTGGATIWNGTVFAPYGDVHIAKTNKVFGTFLGLTVTTENDITVTCVPFDQPPPPCPSACVFADLGGVSFGPITKTGLAAPRGAVKSNGDIDLAGSSQVGGVEGAGNFTGGTNVVAEHITMDGNVTIAGGTRVTTDLNAGGFIVTGTNIVIGFGGAGNAVAGGDVTLVGGNIVHGNVDAGGDVALSNNTAHVDGNVTAAGAVTKAPTAFVGGTITEFGAPAAPLAYTPIPLPPATTFSSGGPDVTTNPGTGGTTLAPGSYGAFDVTGAHTSFTLTAGDYYFDSFNYQSTFPALEFDVTGGPIRVFVTGNVTIRQSATISVVGGDAGDVYLETHGDFTTGGATVWNGIVFAPYGEIYIAKTNKVTGEFWGQSVTTENDVTITCINICPF